jgi:hypothetical protein
LAPKKSRNQSGKKLVTADTDADADADADDADADDPDAEHVSNSI